MELHPSVEFLRPLVTGWLSKIELAKKYKSRWTDIADECTMFYSRSAAVMWDSSYAKKFWKGVPAPRFRVSINKAFEMVAVFGPSLMFDIPHRLVEPKRLLEIPIELFGDPNDEQVQQFYQGMMQEEQQETLQDRLVSHLMQRWLNYTPREQPGGGLEEHSILAVIDALVKGMGILWIKPYQFPDSQRVLTGCFHERPENLFTDPDYHKREDAKWMAIRRVAPTWEVERRFKLEKDSLKNKSTLESAWAEGEYKTVDEYGDMQSNGHTNDMMVYYEIFSKTGPGSRLTGMQLEIKQHLEETVGDYAWIVVAPNVPYPLNCPSEFMRKGAGDEAIREAFSWPVPTWKDDRFPFEILEFYPDTDYAWPIAPLAPAMGELKFLNIMIPHLMNRIWSSSRDFWAVVQPAVEEFSTRLREGLDQTVLPIPTALGHKISDVVQVLQQPATNLDVWRIIDAVSELFDKRTGLTEFQYGRNEGGTQDRSAETTMRRASAAGVRPEYMAKRVVGWQSRAASLEAYCSALFVRGQDVSPLMGGIGSQLWDALVATGDAERIARQFQYTVASSSIRRPNKDRDAANMNQAIPTWLPIAAGAAQQNGDYTPVNEMMRKWGEAVDMNMEGVEIHPPEPDPQVQQMQQQQMELEMAKLQAEAQKGQAEAESKQMDLQIKTQEAGLKQQLAVANLEMKQAAAAVDMKAKGAQSQLELEVDQAKAVQDIKQDQARAALELRQDQQKHLQELLQAEQTHRQKLAQQQALGQLQAKLTQQKAKQANAQAKKVPKKSS